MIWLKRVLPLIVLGLAWLGYSYWSNQRTAHLAQEEELVALVTAQVWVATALFRDDPDAYLAYRDSLLAASGVPRERVMAFLEDRQEDSENMLPFSQRVKLLVDSLAHIEDSLARAEKARLVDSLREADSLPTTSSD